MLFRSVCGAELCDLYGFCVPIECVFMVWRVKRASCVVDKRQSRKFFIRFDYCFSLFSVGSSFVRKQIEKRAAELGECGDKTHTQLTFDQFKIQKSFVVRYSLAIDDRQRLQL